MGELTPRNIVKEGLDPITPVYETATVADTCPNDGFTFLHYKNLHGVDTPTITIDSLKKCDQGVDDDITSGAIPITTGELMIGPFERGRFNNAAGHIVITASVATNLKVAAFSLKP